MTHIDPGDDAALFVRAADAEIVGFSPQTVQILADSSSTAGKLSAQRVMLANGVDGAKPDHHAGSAELFHVLGGSVQLLVGDRLLVADNGDVVVVPAGLPHAFAAPPGSVRASDRHHPRGSADRVLPPPGQIAAGQQPPESLLDVQARYDTFFDDSPAWPLTRAGRSGPARR